MSSPTFVSTVQFTGDPAVDTPLQEKITELEKRFASELSETQEQLRQANEEAIKKYLDEWRDSQRPPSADDINKLLSQEYLEFTVTVANRPFVIREMTIKAEKKFFQILKTKLLPHVRELAELTTRIAEGELEGKIETVLGSFEPALDLLSEVCALVLNPRNEDAGVNKEWIEDNLSSYRMWNIVYAQYQANRLRDFFSQLSRDLQSQEMKGLGAYVPR